MLCVVVLGGWYFHHRAVVETARRQQMAHEQEVARERERSREQEKKRQEELAAEVQRDKERLTAQKAEEEAQKTTAAEAAAAATPYPTATPSHELDGTWTGRYWMPPKRQYRLVGGWFYDTLVVRDGTIATFTEENTSELEPDMGYWSDMPAPYNKTREHYRKFKADAKKVEITDTSVEISLNEWQLVDWKPKNYPAEAFLNTPYPKFRDVSLTRKSNDELTIMWIESGEEILRRVK
jgi:hypothetical protein